MSDREPRIYYSDGEPAPLRYVVVVPDASGGKIDKLWVSEGDRIMAGVVFPDGRLEVHEVTFNDEGAG